MDIGRSHYNRWSVAFDMFGHPWVVKEIKEGDEKSGDELQQYRGNVNWYLRERNRDIWRQHAKAFVLQWTDHG